MKKRKKIFLTITLLIVALLLSSAIVFAVESTGTTGSTDILAKADSAKVKIVNNLQRVAKTLATVFIVWAGYIYWGAGGDSQKMAAAKSKLQYFFVALFFIFGAENIVNTLWDIFGVDKI